jgi:phage-related protein
MFIWNAIYDYIQPKLQALYDFFVYIWNIISGAVSRAWEWIKNAVTSAVDWVWNKL